MTVVIFSLEDGVILKTWVLKSVLAKGGTSYEETEFLKWVELPGSSMPSASVQRVGAVPWTVWNAEGER